MEMYERFEGISLYTKKKKKKYIFNEKRIIFVIGKKNLHPLLVHVKKKSTDGLYKVLLKGDKCKLSPKHEHHLYLHVHPCSCIYFL
jgi:hypothetical protein